MILKCYYPDFIYIKKHKFRSLQSGNDQKFAVCALRSAPSVNGQLGSEVPLISGV